MTEARTVLDVEQEIIEAEAAIARGLFLRRIARTWLFGVTPIIIGGSVAGNIFIDFSKPGDGRFGLNVASVLVFLFSTILASMFWWDCRTVIDESQVNLRKLNAEKNSLLSTFDHSFNDTFRNYLESVPLLRDDYRRGADRYRSRHNRFQITVIVGSILTSVATTAATESETWKWAAVALSATVSVSAGIISYFKFRERSMNLQQTADLIERELQAFILGIRRYKIRATDPDKASSDFAEEVERIKEEQRARELQLEQPPEVDQANSTANART